MELRQLEAFLAAAERGSFRRAAEALFLSQPSLSARVHALEQELGVPLFHRMGRGVRLTEMGKAFRPYTERAIEALRQGRDVIDTTLDASGGVLQIASARAIGTYTLPSMLERFRQQYPSIKVHINIGRSSNVLQMVVEEEVQVGLSRMLTHPDVVTIHLYDEDICLATSPQHPIAIRGEASIYEVALEPLILYDRDSSYFVLIDQVCREAGISPRWAFLSCLMMGWRVSVSPQPVRRSSNFCLPCVDYRQDWCLKVLAMVLAGRFFLVSPIQ